MAAGANVEGATADDCRAVCGAVYQPQPPPAARAILPAGGSAATVESFCRVSCVSRSSRCVFGREPAACFCQQPLAADRPATLRPWQATVWSLEGVALPREDVPALRRSVRGKGGVMGGRFGQWMVAGGGWKVVGIDLVGKRLGVL